jgi:hypothetical protein
LQQAQDFAVNTVQIRLSWRRSFAWFPQEIARNAGLPRPALHAFCTPAQGASMTAFHCIRIGKEFLHAHRRP